jgi:copper chaperone
MNGSRGTERSSRLLIDIATVSTPSVVGAPINQEINMLQFHIPNMTCGSCAKPVRDALLSVDPLAQIETDTPARQVRVETALGETAFLAVLAEAGYPHQLQASQ